MIIVYTEAAEPGGIGGRCPPPPHFLCKEKMCTFGGIKVPFFLAIKEEL